MPSVSRGIYKWLVCRGASLEDFADRLNHFWTVGLLLLFAAIISWRQTYTSPIYCWTPQEFSGVMSQYATDQCWNSYYIVYPEDYFEAIEDIYEMLNISVGGQSLMTVTNTPSVFIDQLTEDSSLLKKMSTTRTLYQWLPLILCFQALLFKLPNLLMYILHSLSGISFDKIAGLTNGYENLTLQERSILCRQIGRYIYNWCQQCKNCLPWRQLTLLWLFIKFLYCVNIIAQLSLVDGLLAPENTTSFGDVIIGNLFQNNATTWKEAEAFPKRIFCDFTIVQLQNTQRYRIQCNLSGNYFSEFAYMFLWVWLVFVAVVTCFSLLIWLLKTLIPVSRKRYIKNALSLSDNQDGDVDMKVIPAYEIGKFSDLIGEDGVMALKLAGSNSSDLMVSEIVRNMWQARAAELRGGQVMTAPTIHVQASAPSTMYPSLQMGQMQQGEKKMD